MVEAALGNGTRSQHQSKSVPDRLNVEIVSAEKFSEVGPLWDDLVSRALVPNVSMHPAVAVAAHEAGKHVHILLAWYSEEPNAPPRLVGVWALTERRLSRKLPFRALQGPVDTQMMLSTPILDSDFVYDALAAMLAKIASTRSLPSIIFLNEFTASGEIFKALNEALSMRGRAPRILNRLTRPKLESDLTSKDYLQRALSAEKRRELGRYKRRLEERGRVEFTWHVEPQEVQRTFEEFLALESAGWKGQRGSALNQRDEATKIFISVMVASLAVAGLIQVMALRLDHRMIAAQVILRCGRTAFTWKTAYDESLRSWAPGLVLMEHVTLTLLDDGNLDYADSSTNQSVEKIKSLADFWTEQLEVADLLIDLRPGRSLAIFLLDLKDNLNKILAYLIKDKRIQRLLDLTRVKV